ncbi:26546_t:CDS:2 [Racocetra persica]|uniref:26546_t:CDS:1 n=1 Tax=Racocetra persica TaxID=160502 RepID=A0ACA9N2G6_9GLOM|nr:26546_t:CDS:2 [Racocetra persica]
MLISDILSEVFEYLDDRDEILGSPNPKTYSSLFSCLLVNSHWCESVIPILWRHPFHRCHKRGGELLIQTFLSCLDNSERQQLYNDGVYVPGGKYDLPVFNYPTFLKNLDYYEMISFVKSWCRFYLEDGTEESVSAILRSILKLFVARINNLSVNDGPSMLVAKKLALLIENQRGLKRIILSRCKKFANIIIPSLEKQKRTLRHIGFRGIDFDGCCKWDTLKYCSKLEKLDIVDCYNINDTMISPLLNYNHHKNFKNLKHVSVYNCRPIRINDKLESWAYRIYCRQRQYC